MCEDLTMLEIWAKFEDLRSQFCVRDLAMDVVSFAILGSLAVDERR